MLRVSLILEMLIDECMDAWEVLTRLVAGSSDVSRSSDPLFEGLVQWRTTCLTAMIAEDIGSSGQAALCCAGV